MKPQPPETRRAILEATRRLLVREGMEGVTMRRLAKELGMSAMAPYTYFATREVLLWTLAQEELDGLLPFLEAGAASGKDPLERLGRVLRAFVEWAMAHPQAYPWLLPSGFPSTVAMLDRVMETVAPPEDDLRLDTWRFLQRHLQEAFGPLDEGGLRRLSMEALAVVAGLAALATPLQSGFFGPEDILPEAVQQGYFWDLLDTWCAGVMARRGAGSASGGGPPAEGPR